MPKLKIDLVFALLPYRLWSQIAFIGSILVMPTIRFFSIRKITFDLHGVTQRRSFSTGIITRSLQAALWAHESFERHIPPDFDTCSAKMPSRFFSLSMQALAIFLHIASEIELLPRAASFFSVGLFHCDCSILLTVDDLNLPSFLPTANVRHSLHSITGVRIIIVALSHGKDFE